MTKILEPIVTYSQALIVTSNYVTIGSMNSENIEFSKRLNTLADEAKLPPKGDGRQVEMAKIFKVSTKGARKWLEGEAIPKTTRINEMANHFGVTTEWLLSGKGQKYSEEKNSTPKFCSETIPNNVRGKIVKEKAGQYIVQNNLIKLPLISEVQAGEWKEAIDNHHPGDADEWIETTAKVSRSSFALRVKGDSMFNPYGTQSIPEGAIVIIDPETPAINGKIVVAKLQDRNEAMLKKLVIDGPNKYLKALNPDYKPIQIDESCIIVGVARRIEIDL